MNKSILIQYKNIPETVNEKFSTDSIIDFDYSDRDKDIKSIDEYISKYIIEQIKDKKFDVIYIKDNLSSNYLELYGLKVAYHIRLTQELKDVRYVPIVILGDIDGFTLNKIEPISNILSTKNIFLEPNRKETIEKYNHLNISTLSQSEYQSKFLDLITVEPPENSTNHSIANKWAIYQWAKELKISNSSKINDLVKELSYQLYFKYIKTKFSILDDGKIDSAHCQQSSRKKMKIQRKDAVKKKVLYIDDEHSKGWDDIFNEYFSKKRGYEFNVLDIKYEGNTFDKLEGGIQKEIIDYKADLIILDMRLFDSDQKKETLPEEISGIKILNSIKSISLETKLNPGTQVIMLTASGRSDILDEALKGNKIVGYIKKVHPEDITINVKKSIEKLKNIIEDGEEKFYLKEIWNTQQQILNLKVVNTSKYNQVKVEASFIFEILNTNTENKLKFAMLIIYKVLEVIKDLYISPNSTFLDNEVDEDDEKEIKAIYSIDDVMYQAYDKNTFFNGYGQCHYISDKGDARKYYFSTENKIHAICYEALDIKNKVIHDLIKKISHKRNKYIHPDKKDETVEITTTEIIDWLNMLHTILQKVT